MMRVVFIGSADLSASMLDMLLTSELVSGGEVKVVGVVSQPDKPAGRSRKLTPCPCKRLADDRGIPCLTPVRINAPDSLTQIAAWLPDVIVVVAYGQFLSKRLLDIPPLGCINIHLSLLPRHRGASPIHACLLHGDSETGACAMLMDEGMDSGPVLQISKTRILPQDDCESLHQRLSSLGGKLLIDVLPRWARHELTPIPQDTRLATFAYKISKADGHLNWDEPVETLIRKIKAFTPWPSCYTYLPTTCAKGAGKLLKILSVEAITPNAQTPVSISAGTKNAPTGTIVYVDKSGIYIKVRDAILVVKEVQPEGGRPLLVGAFINGTPLQVGDRFESAPVRHSKH